MTEWACTTCTFAGNPALFLACGICNAPRHAHFQSARHPVMERSATDRSTCSSTSTRDVAVVQNDNNAKAKPKRKNTMTNKKKDEAIPLAPLPRAEAPVVPVDQTRRPPQHTAIVKNLSDREYCCVWSVEVFPDGYRPDAARMLLATVARHVNPILRDRGWRCKRLMESASPSWIGLCTGNDRRDADAASVNIQLNLRWQPSRHCPQFRPFHQILGVMLHEITHTKIGLEDIHPPAFWELLDEIKGEYRRHLVEGQVALETHDYGCRETVVTASGHVKTIEEASLDVVRQLGVPLVGAVGTTTTNYSSSGNYGNATFQEDECGAKKRRRRSRRGNNKSSAGRAYQSNVPKKRPLLKGKKMVDGRTKHGKVAKAELETLTPQELAARAAMARLGGGQPSIAAPPSRHARVRTSSSSSTAAVTSGSAGSRDDGEEKSSSDTGQEHDGNPDDGQSGDDEDDSIVPHTQACGCRACDWDRMLFVPESEAS